jgi:hypothetical protein
MYVGSYDIDDALTFSVNTHDPSTGAESDADAPPTYRVYEDETGTAVLTGTMALLDDANTLGQYSEQITLSAANGFELGKCYTVRIRGVVGGVAGSTSRQFQVGAKVDTRYIDGQPADFSADPVDANLTQIDGVANASATLNLKKLNVVNADAGGVAVQITASGSGSTRGVKIDSTHTGLYVAAGYGANVLASIGPALNLENTAADNAMRVFSAGGIGMSVNAGGDNPACYWTGGGTGPGLRLHGGETGSGLVLARGSAGTHDVHLENTAATTLRDAILTAGAISSTVAPNLDAAVSSRSSHTAANVLTAFGTGAALTALATAASVTTLQTSVDAVPTNAELAAAIITGLTTALAEGYKTAGATASVRDMLYEILQNMTDSSISGTTKTARNLAGTAAKTYTLNSATTPTSITELT